MRMPIQTNGGQEYSRTVLNITGVWDELGGINHADYKGYFFAFEAYAEGGRDRGAPQWNFLYVEGREYGILTKYRLLCEE